MRLRAVDLDTKMIHRGQGRARGVADLAYRELRPRVEPEDRVGLRICQHALRHHQLRAAFFTRRTPLLGRLKDELHRAGNLVANRGEHGGDSQLHRRVDVVAARMHHARLLAEVGRAYGRLEREVRRLGDGKRVHVRAHRHHRSGLAASQDPDHAGMCDVRRHLIETEGAEVLGHQLRRLELAIPELRMLVDPMTESDDLRRHAIHLDVDERRQRRPVLHGRRLGDHRRRAGHYRRGDEHRCEKTHV